MKKNKIYIGKINEVENGNIKLYLHTCPLLSLGDGKYINIEWIKTIEDYLSFYKGMITGTYKDELLISDRIPKEGIYVDRESLIPYYNENDEKSIGVKKLNEEIMLDPRMPRGIEYKLDGTKVMYPRRPNPKKLEKVLK